jgi:hypothetical protein
MRRFLFGLGLTSICMLAALGWSQSSPTATTSPRQKTAATQQKSGGPRLTETTSWLSDRIGEAGLSAGKRDAIVPGYDVTYDISQSSYRAEWNGCKLVLHYLKQSDIHNNDTTHPNNTYEIRGTDSFTVTIHLSSLSEAVSTSEVKTNSLDGFPLTGPAWNVNLTSGGEPIVIHTVHDMFNSANPASQTEQTYENSFGGFSIPFGSAEIAGRVAKAFSHAIHLCSQKKEPF